MKGTCGWLALALVAALACGGTSASDVEEMTRYDLRVTLDPMAQTLVGSQRIDYVNDTGQAIEELLFALLANWGTQANPYLHPALLDAQYVRGFDPTWTRIRRVTDAEGQALPFELEPFPPSLQTYSLEDGILAVDLPAPLAPGDRFTLDIQFETRFAEALTVDNFVYRDTYVWRFGWNPIVVPSTAREGGFVLPAAGYRVELTVPDGYRAFGGADHQSELRSAAGWTTYELTNDRPARSVPLVIGTDLSSVSSTWNGVEIEAVYLPGGESFARLSLSFASDILEAHSARYGPFGYRRLVLVDNPSPGLYGLASDGMILIGQSAVSLKDMPVLGMYDRLVEYLLAHELAHLWWGIGIGADFDAENWISEGFAEYLSIGYIEEKYGAFEPNLFDHLGDGLIEEIVRNQLGYLNLRQHLSEAAYVELLRLGFDEAIIQPTAESDYLNGQTVRTYNKGYLVLRALEARIGRETLRTILVQASAEWRGKVLTADAFRHLAEDVSGVDLSGFFDDWLYGDVQFDVRVSGFDVSESGDGYANSIYLHRDGARLPVEILATLENGTTVRTTWEPESAEGIVLLETSHPVVRVHADPDEMLPDANRFDNHFPRRILVDHPFRASDADPIGLPLDAYVIDVSGVGIRGGFRNDHAWALNAIPHIDAEETVSDVSDLFAVWDIAGQFAANVSRRLSVSALATVSSLDLDGGSGELDAQITLQTRAFTHPETGSAGTYWYPTYQSDLTLGARGDLSAPIPYLGLAVGLSGLPTRYLETAVSFRVGIPGLGTSPFATVAWSGSKRFRLAHLFYLDIDASASTSLLETLPTEFLFSLDGLHAFAGPPYGDRRLFGRAELVLPPLVRNAGYAIANLTRIENVTAGAFVQAGRAWGGCDRACESGIRIEAGGQLTFTLDAVLGATIDVTVGYAVPLFGPDGQAVPFVDLGIPL